MQFKTYGTTTLSEFLGDNVAYRNLVPADPRLPAVADLSAELGLESGTIPRKSDPAYGRVVAELLRRGRQLERPGVPIERLVYVGDSAHNDGLAFANILAATGWPGWAFIGRDSPGESPEVKNEDALYLGSTACSSKPTAQPPYPNFWATTSLIATWSPRTRACLRSQTCARTWV